MSTPSQLEDDFRTIERLRAPLSPAGFSRPETELDYYKGLLADLRKNQDLARPIAPSPGPRRWLSVLRYLAMRALRPVISKLFCRQVAFNVSVIELLEAVIYLECRVKALEGERHGQGAH